MNSASSTVVSHDVNIPFSAPVSRREAIKAMSTATLCAALGESALFDAAASASSPQRRPNIVFVFSDEHRWCSLPFTEMPELVTPHLTQLRQEGLSFDHCCSTSPICTPYRAMLLTGLWPNQTTYYSNDTFVDGDYIGKKTPSLAQTFGAAGYRTGYIGKWHLIEETVHQAGFDHFKHWLYGDDHWETQMRDVPSREAFRTVKGYNAVGMTDQAIEFIQASAAEPSPFMLMLSLNPPHWRWDDAPEEFYKLYPPEKLPFRPNVTAPEAKTGKMLEYYRHYHAHITAVDREMGRVMTAIDQAGIADNTILIYTSDHGSSFGSNGVFNKGNPFDESVRVPFLVRWPGHIAAGATATEQFGTIDLYPTLCGLAGIRPPAACEGKDFSPTIRGRSGPEGRSQLLLVNNYVRNYYSSRLSATPQRLALTPFRAVRTARYTYAVDPLGSWFLYDNVTDPYQQHNRVDDPSWADLRAELHAELLRWLARAEDPYIPKDWLALSLPERIARGNEFYTLLLRGTEIESYRQTELAAHLPGASDAQRLRLVHAAKEIFDDDFFGLYFALKQPVKAGETVANAVVARLAEWEADRRRRFAEAVARIRAA